MKSGCSLLLCTAPSLAYRRPAFLNSFTPAAYLYRQVKNYSRQEEREEMIDHIEERAPSTAQILKQLEEEKVAAKAVEDQEDHGSGSSQTVEKAHECADAADEHAYHAAEEKDQH